MERLPSLFISHGAPSFALEPGLAGPRLTALGEALPRPKAVLVVSPHWMTPTPRVGTSLRPSTIHDFGGFAPALYAIAGWPLLVAAAAGAMEPTTIIEGGITHGVLVMDSFVFGPNPNYQDSP